MLFNELVLMRLFYFENFFFLMRIAAIPTIDNVAINPLVIAIEPPHPPFPSGLTVFAVAVTIHSSEKLPSSVVTVMVTCPTSIAVTSPVELTEIIVGLLLDQVTFLLVALLGVMVATNVSEISTGKDKVLLLSDTPVTGMTASVTVTIAVPLTSLSRVEVAVMVAVPTAIPVTVPLLTVAMLLLLLVQVTLEEPVSTVTLRAIDCDTAIVGVEGDNVMVFGAVTGVPPPNGSASVY